MHALIGSGEYLPAMAPVDRDLIARLGAPVRVVCLPTAAGTEGSARVQYWMDLGVAHFEALGAQVTAVPVIDRASADDPAHAAAIAAANFVYLSGGKPDYLHRSLDGSRAWNAILDVLARGGLLAGCSAGAMVQGAQFFGFPGSKPGFGFLPGVSIIPHFDEIPGALVQGMKLFGRGTTVVGIDGFTALVKDGANLDVVGRGRVTIFTREGRLQLTAGPVPRGLLPE